MATIKVLRDVVANQIAAGEVVERPVAVVKELIENSLDAGATRVEVDFRNGGKSYIRVSDNGSGMSGEDALMCFERHGTSKLREIGDLDEIRTFGFRGEAIPSIASVSRFILRTRRRGEEVGREVCVNGGRMEYNHEMVVKEGTEVEVMNLFGNVPARRKFLKTEGTEAAHIVNMVLTYALGYPEVGFRLDEDGRTLINVKGGGDIRQRMKEIKRSEDVKGLLDVEKEEGGLRMYGLTSPIGVSRSTRQEIQVFINRRPVDSKTVVYAIQDAYYKYIPKGRYPVSIVYLEMAGKDLDVNVHPAKREVRFRREAEVRQFIYRGFEERLRRAEEEAVEKLGMRKEVFVEEKEKPLALVHSERRAWVERVGKVRTEVREVEIKHEERKNEGGKEVEGIRVETKIEGNEKDAGLMRGSDVKVSEGEEGVVRGVERVWRFLGVVMGAYGVYEEREGLLVVSVKHARERIFFDQIKRELREGKRYSQLLLMPVAFQLDAVTGGVFEENMEFLNKNGFNVEIFGRNFYRVDAVPGWLEGDMVKGFLEDFAGMCRETGGSKRDWEGFIDKVCYLALSRERRRMEVREEEVGVGLIEELMRTTNPMVTPYGKATLVRYTRGEFEKRFGM